MKNLFILLIWISLMIGMGYLVSIAPISKWLCFGIGVGTSIILAYAIEDMRK